MKAFNRLPHKILLIKLKEFGFPLELIKLIASYLNLREHRVRYRNVLSDPFFPTSSVIQGSKLSTLFFADGIGNNIKISQYQLFADDFKLYREINSLEDSNLLQRDLSTIG